MTDLAPNLNQDRVQDWISKNPCPGQIDIRFAEPLSRHLYIRAGGSARLFLIPKDRDALVWSLELVADFKAKLLILGLGSNLLVSDLGFDGVVIKSTQMNLDFEVLDLDRIHSGSSLAVSTFLRKGLDVGLGNFSFLAGIPGAIGGAVVMNAGTNLGETRERLTQVEVIDRGGVKRIIEGQSLGFSYRENHFLSPGEVVWSTTWRAEAGDREELKRQYDEVLSRRKQIQPLEWPSFGSVFKNPSGTSLKAWQVIEKLGLRGHQMGQAQISLKHPNWIVNLGGAKVCDIVALIEGVKARSLKELGILMQEEVKIVG